MHHLLRRALAPALVSLALAACGDSTLAPFQPEIGNAADNFQFQVTALTNVTTSVEYPWQNSGTSANVNQSTSLTAGTANVTILDAAGATVYAKALTENGTFQTTAGQAGSWRIRVVLQGASGAVNFRVQKR
ncbi:MAG TPA: hypothetical protein VGD77_00990 [Gemmatimonadaceae bacterium]